MKIFLSWSGDQSKTVATALRRWLPDVIQSVKPWMSETDIDAGARWSRRIEQELGDTRFGILCLTRSNCTAPWLLFEAGALAKTIEETFVCPYLIGMSPSDMPEGPLTQFQAKGANQEGTWELLQAINRALRDDKLDEDQLVRTYERWWPDLEKVLAELPPEGNEDEATRRSLEDMIAETLELVRGLSRRASVRTSFEWPQDPSRLGEILRRNPSLLQAVLHRLDDNVAVNEYQCLLEEGDRVGQNLFLKYLDQCVREETQNRTSMPSNDSNFDSSH